MSAPHCAADMPRSRRSTGSATNDCMNMYATMKLSEMKATKRRSAIGAQGSARGWRSSRSGRDSGMRSHTTRAKASVVAASPTKSKSQL